MDDLIEQTKSKIHEIEQTDTLDNDKDKDIIDSVLLLLMVVNPSEYYAAMNNFCKKKVRRLNYNGTTYYVGKWGDISAALVRQKESGYHGAGRSQELTCFSIDLFRNLQVIVALGICGTVRKIGSVVVSSKIYGCTDPKIIADGMINQSYVDEPGDRIFNCLKDNNELWSFLCTKPGYDEYKSKVAFEPMISGTPLIADGEYRDKLIKVVSDEAAGVEMEGVGVLEGIQKAKKSDKIQFIIVKAGCDYADESKNKEWQPVAAMAAADFLYKQLTKRGVYEQVFLGKFINT